MNKKIYALLLLVFVLVTLSAASAADVKDTNQTIALDSSSDIVAVSNDDSNALKISNDDEIQQISDSDDVLGAGSGITITSCPSVMDFGNPHEKLKFEIFIIGPDGSNYGEIPSATVWLNVDGERIASTTSDEDYGAGSFSLSSLPSGTHSVKCEYDGSEIYDASESATKTITVNGGDTPGIKTEVYLVSSDGYSIEMDYGESKTLTVEVYSDDQHMEPLSGVNLKLSAKSVTITATSDEEGYATFDLSTAPVGTYTAIVDVVSDTYEADSTLSISFKVNGDAPEKTIVYLDDGGHPTEPINEGDNAQCTVTVSDGDGYSVSNVKVKATIDKDYYGFSDNLGKVYFDLSGVPADIYTVNFVVDDDNYESFEPLEYQLTVNSKPESSLTRDKFGDDNILKIQIGDNVVLNATLKDKEENKPISGATVVFIINGTEHNETTDDEGKASYTVSGLTAGNHTVNYRFDGNDNYKGDTSLSDINDIISVSKIDTHISVNESSLDLKVGGSAPINATLTPANAGTLSYTSSNTSVVVVDEKGNVTAKAVGEANITVSFAGDDTYAPAKDVVVTVTVTLNDASVAAKDITLEIDANTTIDATTTPEGLKVTYTPDDSGVVTVENGVVTGVKNGTAKITLTVGGDGGYAENSTTITVTVNKIHTEISVNDNVDMNVGDIVDVNATLTPADAGNLTYYSMTPSVVIIENGKVKAIAEGKATVVVSFAGNDKYNAANANITVKVSKISTEITVENTTLTLNALDQFDSNATLNPVEAGKLTFNSSDENIVQVDEDGKITALGKGNAIITVSFAGNDKYLAAENKTIKVTVNINDASVSAKDITLTVGENATIDATTNPEGLTIDYVIVNSGVVKVENGVVTALKAGTAEITLIVGDDEAYVKNSTTITVTVYRIDTSIEVENKSLELYVGGEGHIVATLNPDGGDVNFTSSDDSIITVDSFGDFKAIGEGTANITVSFAGDDKYNPAENVTVSVKVSKIDTSIEFNMDPLSLKVYGESIVTATLNPAEAGNVTYTSTNPSVVTVDSEGNVKAVGAGNATIIASFAGNNKYNEAENKTVPVTVSKIDTKITVDTESLDLKVDNKTAVKGTLTPAEAGNVSYMSNNNSVVTVDENTGEITAVGEGTATIIVFYDGDDVYNMADDVTIDVKVSKIDTNITVDEESLNLKVGDDSSVTATLTPADAGNVVFTSSNSSVVTVDKNGKVIAVGAGSANITASYAGNDKYNAAENVIVAVTVTLNDAKVSAEDITLYVGANATIDATTTPEGLEVTYTPDNSGVVSVKDGVVSAVKAGTAKITLTVGGDGKYAENSTTITVTVKENKQNATMDIGTGEVVEDENSTITINLPKDATGNVTAVVEGNEYTAPVVNGTANIAVPGLRPGNYSVPVTYSGDDKYNHATEKITYTVEVDKSDIISAPDVTKYYKGSERFVVNITDYEGNPVANRSVSIVINSKEYNRTTDANGTASIALGLNSGVYNATVTVGNKTSNSVVTILPTVNGTDVVKVYRNATQYYATFRDSQGNYLKEGTVVKFNINGVMYERKISGSEGLAKLNLNLQQGTYVLTAMNPQTGENAANNITIISRLVENSDITKYYRNATQYTVKVIGDDGNAVGAGETVTFNINGVMYTRTTNASGIAKLNLNLQPGDYIITAEYKDCKVSNNIKILPVLSARDISMKYRDGSKFVATLVDGQGKPFAGQTIQFNINGVFYNRVTDANGQAKLNINLMAGQYIITSSYNGANIANTVSISA